MKRQRVGARSAKAILADPLASAAEIKALSAWSPATALRHPNCPQELWWALAESYPFEAPNTPAGFLFLLEEPDRWIEMESRLAEHWIIIFLDQLPSGKLHLFAADCAAHVLPLYEQKHPTNLAPRAAIEATRRYVPKKSTSLTVSKMNILSDAAEQAALDARPFAYSQIKPEIIKQHNECLAAMHAARAASQAAMISDAARKRAGVDAADAAYHAGGNSSTLDTAAHRAAKASEFVWQWRCLLGYLQKGKR